VDLFNNFTETFISSAIALEIAESLRLTAVDHKILSDQLFVGLSS